MCKSWDYIFVSCGLKSSFPLFLNIQFQYPYKHRLRSPLPLIIVSQKGKTCAGGTSLVKCASYQLFFYHVQLTINTAQKHCNTLASEKRLQDVPWTLVPSVLFWGLAGKFCDYILAFRSITWKSSWVHLFRHKTQRAGCTIPLAA